MTVPEGYEKINESSSNLDQLSQQARILERSPVPGTVWLAVQGISALYSVGQRLWASGNRQAAWSCYDRALSIGCRALPAGHSLIGAGLEDLSSWLDELPADEEAIPTFEAALTIWDMARGADHPDG